MSDTIPLGPDAKSVPPPPPPLRSRNPGNYSPLRVFGFLVSLEKLDEWAKKHGIGGGEKQDIRRQMAWKMIMKQRPEGWIALHTVYNRERRPMRCIILATNESTARRARASDVDLIQKYKEHLATDEDPGWYRPYS